MTSGGAVSDHDGRVIAGRWELVKEIGSGSAGTLWSATDLENFSSVAVKIARTGDRSFDRESAFQASVESPYIAKVLASGVADCGDGVRAYLVQELVSGQNLRDVLRTGTPHNVDVTAWAYGLLRALVVIHAEGIVHRDIKPSNIVIPFTAAGTPSPQPKLVDFGTAEREPGCDDKASARGTVLYMSPEQARGSGVGSASDVYSLGLVILECLTGYRAFNLPAIESLVARTQRTPRIPDELPAHWDGLIRAMTAMDPALRPTATQAIAMLTRPRVRQDATCAANEALALAV